jgi:hypothetical protein
MPLRMARPRPARASSRMFQGVADAAIGEGLDHGEPGRDIDQPARTLRSAWGAPTSTCPFITHSQWRARLAECLERFGECRADRAAHALVHLRRAGTRVRGSSASVSGDWCTAAGKRSTRPVDGDELQSHLAKELASRVIASLTSNPASSAGRPSTRKRTTGRHSRSGRPRARVLAGSRPFVCGRHRLCRIPVRARGKPQPGQDHRHCRVELVERPHAQRSPRFLLTTEIEALAQAPMP